MKKLLVFDLDHTLLNERGELSRFTIKTVRQCIERNYLIAYASARTMPDIYPYLRAFNVDAVIACGGAQMYIDGNEIVVGTIQLESFLRLYDDLMRISSIKKIKFAGSLGVSVIESPFTLNNCLSFNDPLYKITVHTSELDLCEKIRYKFPELAVYPHSDSNALMITSATGTKLSALNKALLLLGIQMEDVIAFGDDESDIEMIQAAGIGVAMMNGVEALKEKADWICEANTSNGVAKWLSSILLS